MAIKTALVRGESFRGRAIFFTTRCRIIGSGAARRQLPLILLPAGKTNSVKQ